MSFNISDILHDFDPKTHRGKCKACQQPVQWSKDKVSSHKRASCANASVEEKRKFAKRKFESLDRTQEDISFIQQSSSAHGSNLTADETREDINAKFSYFFYRSGISFRLAESDALKDLITALNPSYASLIPTAKRLSGSLLDAQYTKCSNRLKEIHETSENLALISDGWTNVRGDHIVNFCIKAPNEKPYFHSSINTSGITQNAIAVAEAIITVIEQLGSHKFSSVITDNAPVMKAAWKLIEQKFPHISAMGCAAHAVNLLIKDILDTLQFTKIIKDSEKIIKFVTNHHIVKAKYDVMRNVSNVPHTLTMAVSTRWFSRFTSLRDLLASKYVLIRVVDEDEELLKEINPKPTSVGVIKLVKSNEFWENLSTLVKTIEYPANIIGKEMSEFFLLILF